MSGIKVERKEALSRVEAASWLAALSKAFATGGTVSLPMGSGTVEFQVPDKVRAEFEVEVEGDDVEIELEFTWSTNPALDEAARDEHPAA